MRPFVPNSFNVYIPIATSVELGTRARERIRDQVVAQGLQGKIPGILFRDAKVAYEYVAEQYLPSFTRKNDAEKFLFYCEDKFAVTCWFDVQLFRLPQEFPPFVPYPFTPARDFLVDLLRTSITREVAIVANTPKAIRTRAYRGDGPYAEPKRWTLEFSGPAWLARGLQKQLPFSPNPDTQPVLTEKKKEQVK